MAETTLHPTQAWGRHSLMPVCAVRYCLGRRTYITGECADWLCDVWPLLPENVKTVIRRDIEEEFARDDAERAAGSEHKPLGDDCDRASWERVRALWEERND